jgi:hypothetical protein
MSLLLKEPEMEIKWKVMLKRKKTKLKRHQRRMAKKKRIKRMKIISRQCRSSGKENII